MNYLVLFLFLIIIGLLWVVWKCYQKNMADKRELGLVEKEKNEYEELGKGLVEYNQKMQDRKNKLKEKILELLKNKSFDPAQDAQARISNHEITKALNISSASAKRYLDELENDGRLKQVGKAGRKVYYSK
ncbi:MAG: winged helix-turn-helix domain-containing protein [Patescibacteria group bacterium]